MSRKKELLSKRKEIGVEITELISEYFKYIDESFIDDTPTQNCNYQVKQLKQLVTAKMQKEKKSWMPDLKKKKRQARELANKQKQMAKKIRDLNDPDKIEKLAEYLFGGT